MNAIDKLSLKLDLAKACPHKNLLIIKPHSLKSLPLQKAHFLKAWYLKSSVF